MRMNYLLGFAAPFVLLLPLSAQAAWPAGEKDNFVKDCNAAASQTVDKKTAKSHCDCASTALEKNFTSEELKTLTSKTSPPPPALRQRALAQVSACKNSK